MRSYAFISGATGGLGLTLAAECAAQGWDLFLTDLSEETLKCASDGLKRLYNVRARTYACDLTDAARSALPARGARRHSRMTW